MSDLDFYLGAASGSQRKAVKQLEAPNVMVSYATQNNQPIETAKRMFYDCGAYSIFAPPEAGGQGLSQYPFTPQQYIDFVAEKEPEYFALMDYVCEPNVRRYHGWTVQRQQKKTLEMHKKCYNYFIENYPEIDSQPVSVIQGWNKEDYHQSLQMLRDAGLRTDTIGIGSVCARKDTSQVKDIVLSLREEIPRDKDIHAFGVKKPVLSYPAVVEALSSADSLASSMTSMYERDEYESPYWWKEVYNFIDFYRSIRSTVERKPKNPAQKQLEVKAK